MSWKEILRSSATRQIAKPGSVSMMVYGQKAPDFRKMHLLMLVPNEEIVSIDKLRKVIDTPLMAMPANDAVGGLKEPIIVFTQVQSLDDIDLPALRASARTGLVMSGEVKMESHGTLWVAIWERPGNVAELRDTFTMVKLPKNSNIWEA